MSKMSYQTTQLQQRKPVVIGLYGVPGSGKTYLLQNLRKELDTDSFAFYEGSQVIDRVAPGGLDAFKLMIDSQKEYWRRKAIIKIQDECILNGKAAIVTGHYMFWEEDDTLGKPVITVADLSVYTHIVYLDIPANIVLQRRLEDRTRDRSRVSASHMERWQRREKMELEASCLEHGILFALWTSRTDLAGLIRHLISHNESYNLQVAKEFLDNALVKVTGSGDLEKALFLDADRTLTAEDTGTIWWKQHNPLIEPLSMDCPLRQLFGSKWGYSYAAFWQATLMYEGAASDEYFERICQDTANEVRMYPQVLALLHLASTHTHIHAFIVTSGLRLVWEKIIAREGLSNSITVIGGGRIADGFVVTPEVKASLVESLQNNYKMEVWAFGDSPLDIPMLKKADRAMVIVGDATTRSRSMENELGKAIRDDLLSAHQVLLPSSVPPRLDTTILPTLDLMEPKFINSLLSHRNPPNALSILDASQKAASKVLQTPMRDASILGPDLRKAHRRCGRYLAAEYLCELIGVETYEMRHVQGHKINGFRLKEERKTLIVALMRSGEPMAFGVNDIFPTASFLHADKAQDLTAERLQRSSTVILVDSVINSGKSIFEFVCHIRRLAPVIPIVVVAGVVQKQAIAGDSPIATLAVHGKLTVVALRVSENKYTGKGGTDTGNCLFNTVHLD
ncbi:uracil phosphoribosyltransferase [Aspergillus affinis]|uniref:uracil phosphoribosyltransferase n=1 Tax=Aspergillus affinis TaxID=1070780 RepID=UPI0022FE7066|nr:uracil phosphoribosyltransferase [Aspergillus affinis]KAI9042046.1 uracil phosphoribosyltransferase [Aspergillus affinis]